MTEYRRKSADEYIKILKHRKWLVILPAVATFLAIGWVVLRLPNLYESTTFLTISPPKISEKVAPSLTDDDLSQRLQAISQNVMSRSSLEPMIIKYDVLREERSAGMPMDLILEKMKSRIKIELEKSDDHRVLGFRISYRDRTPDKTQLLTADLASKFVTTQNAESTLSAETTRQFIENQLAQAKSNLDSLEKQRLEIMSQNVDTLPESAQGLIAQLSGLRQREQTISKDKETLMTEQGRIQESIRALNSQIRLIEDFGEKDTQDAVTQASRIEDTPAYGQLIQKRAELSGKLESLKKQYRDKHPDIVQTQTDIAKINEELEKLAKNNDIRVRQAMQSSSRKAELQKQSLSIEKEKASGQLDQISQQLQTRDRDMQQNSLQIAALEQKLNTIPNVKIALEGLNNQYESAKSTYDDLSKKYNNATQQVQVETDAQGETIRVVDPANLPQTSVNASKKPLFLAGGAGIGVLFGLLLTAIFEAPTFFRLRSIVDAEYYTELPVWASIPPLLSEDEVSRRRNYHLLRIAVGIIAALASVPFLVLILQISRVFERLS